MRLRTKRNLLLLIAASICATASATYFVVRSSKGEDAGSLPELLALAPADSRLLAYVDVTALRGSPLVQRLAAMAAPVKPDRDYADFTDATGFDYQRDLDRVVISERADEKSAQTLAFAEGRFNREKIQQYALRSGKLTHEGGHDVYVMPSSTAGKNLSLAFLSTDRIVLADGGSLAAVFEGPRVTSDLALRQRISRISGTPIFALAKTPAGGAGIGPNGGSQTFSSSFQALRWLSFAARPDRDELLVSIEGECDTPDQAQNVATGLEFLRGILRSGLNDPKIRGRMTPEDAAAIGQLLSAAQVSTDAARVRLLLTVTSQMLETPENAGHGANSAH